VDNALLVYDRWVIWVEGSPAFAVFHRPELDAYLARQAADRGTVIHENEAVESLVPQADGVIVVSRKATYRAQVVVGADGSKGISRSLVEHNRRRTRVARLLEMLCPASEMSPVFTHHYAVFDFTPLGNGLQGYFWQFPARVNGLPALNCGVYDARLASKRPRARLMSILENGLRTWGGEEVQLSPEGHPIHWFSPRNRFSAPRLLLVGDAAGAEPLFGEGIAPALGYGQVAAASIQAAFASGDFSFRDYRRRLLTSPIGRYLMLRWAVAEVAYRLGDRAWFMPLLWWFSRIVARLWPTSPRLY
jgi:flavin-dependent dehydrogenase